MAVRREVFVGEGWGWVLGAIALCLLVALAANRALTPGEPTPGPGYRDRGEARPPKDPDVFAPVTRPSPPARLADPPGRRSRRARVAGARRPAAVLRVGEPLRESAPSAPLAPQAPAPGAAPPPAAAPAASPSSAPPRVAPETPSTPGTAIRDTTAGAGGAVGQVSPPLGRAVTETGDSAGASVDRLLP